MDAMKNRVGAQRPGRRTTERNVRAVWADAYEKRRASARTYNGRRSDNRSVKLTLVKTRSAKRVDIELTAEEAMFLRWLLENGGRGTRSGTNWMSNDLRLARAGYVRARRDSSNPNTTLYTLASGGANALRNYDAAKEKNGGRAAVLD
jgi:hypothetical protein